MVGCNLKRSGSEEDAQITSITGDRHQNETAERLKSENVSNKIKLCGNSFFFFFLSRGKLNSVLEN